MEFELGQTYAGYQFLDVVKRSRNTVQYRVQNILAQRTESLRTLTAVACDDPGAAECFLREVRIRARLSHPHIVTFYTAVPIDGRIAMTTELPDSPSLAERLKLGPLPWRDALDITRQLLEAVACLHRQSLVHCGITPESILFGPGVFCKLADFALARPLDETRTAESGGVAGTPRYISPEQVRGDGHLDPRTDVYSAGVVLYEMLCGHAPFESHSQFELMMAQVNQAPAPPSSLLAQVPRFLDGLVLKALAKDAADRYPSAAAFAAAIAEIAGREPVEPEPAPGLAPVIVPEAAPLSEQAEAAPEPVIVSEIAEAVTAPAEVLEAAAVTVEVAAPPEIVPELAPVSPDAAVLPEPDRSGATPEPVSPEAAAVIVEVAAPPPEIVPEPAPPIPEAAAVLVEVAAPLPEIVPEPAPVSPDAVAVIVEVAAPLPKIVPELAPVSAEAAAVTVEVAAPPPDIVPEITPVTQTATVIIEIAAPPLDIVTELAPVSPEGAAVIVEVAAPPPDIVPEPAPPIPEAAAVIVEVAAPPADIVPERAPVSPAADVVVEVAAPPPDIVPETTPVTQAANVLIEIAAPPPDIVPEPASPIPEAVAGPARIDAPSEPAQAQNAMQDTLWAAAAMVAEAASTHAPPPTLPAPARLPRAAPPPEPVPVAPPVREFEPIPAFMTNLRHAPDPMQWFVFGGTAAFLGVIWAAICLSAGK